MPHDFILDLLFPLEVTIKKMFGNHAIYYGDKILMATRENENKSGDNGIWIGTSFDHHESLKKQFSSLTALQAFNVKKWLLLPSHADDFESSAREICELIKQGDPRIGVEVKKK